MTEINQFINQEIEKVDRVKQARFSKDFNYIVDSDGQKIGFNDSRIVFVDPEPRNPYGRQLVINLYKLTSQIQPYQRYISWHEILGVVYIVKFKLI